MDRVDLIAWAVTAAAVAWIGRAVYRIVGDLLSIHPSPWQQPDS